jgi:hypothetical protein
MKTVKLNKYLKSKYPQQNLFIKVVKADNPGNVLAVTETYPSFLTLPATFAVNPFIKIHLYKELIAIQLWGDSTGLIASNTINMKEYKIIYPIDMEMGNDSVSFSVTGNWK